MVVDPPLVAADLRKRLGQRTVLTGVDLTVTVLGGFAVAAMLYWRRVRVVR